MADLNQSSQQEDALPETLSPPVPEVPSQDAGGATPGVEDPDAAGETSSGGVAPEEAGEAETPPAVVPLAPTPNKISKLEAATYGLVQGATMNWGDEAGAVIDTLGITGSGPNLFNSNASFTDLVAQHQREIQQEFTDAADQHPGYYIGANLVGGLAVPLGKARSFGQFVRAGAIAGFASGAGEGESLGERGVNAAIGATGGAAAGGALFKLGQGAKYALNKVLGRETLTATEQATKMDVPYVGDLQREFDAGATKEEILAKVPTGQSPPDEAQLDAAIAYRDNGGKGASFQMKEAGTQPDGTPHPDPQPTPPQIVGWTEPDSTGVRAPIHMEAPTVGPKTEEPVTAPAPEGTTKDPAQEPPIESGQEASAPPPPDQNTTAFQAWDDILAGKGGPSLDVTGDAPDQLALRSIRLGRLGSVKEAQQLMMDQALSLTRKEVRPDTELATSALNAANLTGSDPATMQALGTAIAGNLKEADKGMAIFAALKSKASEEVGAIHLMNVDWSTASPELITTAKEAIHNLSVLTQMDIDAATGIGRALRSRQLPDAETYLTGKVNREAERMADKGVSAPKEPELDDQGNGVQPSPPPREVRPLPETPEEIRDFFQLWGMTGHNPKMQRDMMTGRLALPSPGLYLRQSFANLFTANILSGPKTVTLNVIGPGIIAGMKNIERMAGGTAMAVNPFLTAEERASGLATAAAVPKAFIQGIGDIQDAMRMGWLAASQNRRITGGGAGNPAEMTTANMPLTQALMDAANVQPDWRYSLGNMINIWPRAFSRVNNGLDEMVTRMSYQGNVRVNAMVEAARQGLTGDRAQAFVGDALSKSIDQAGVATDHGAMEAAERVTLMGTPGQPGSAARTTSNWVNTLRREVPEFRYVMPVFNIPANAIGYTLEHLPIARLPGLSEHLGFGRNVQALKGELGPVAQAEAHGQAMMGASMLAAGFMMNKMGLLTGAGPQDPSDRRVWLLNHQPYSIRVGGDDVPGHEGVRSVEGGNWVDYRKIDVLGGLLSIAPTISDATTYRRDDAEASDMVWAGVGAMMQWSKDRAAFQQLATLMGVGDDPTKSAGGVAFRMGASVAQGMMAPAVITRTGTDMTDPYVRMRTSWEDYIKGAIPGLSKEVDPQRNIFGEPLLRPNDTLVEALFPVTSSPAGSYKKDPEADELTRLYQKTGFGAGSVSRALSYGHFDPRQMELEDGRSFYDHAEKLRQSVEVDGSTLRQTLNDLFNSPEYNDAVDGSAKYQATSLDEASRPYMVSKVFKTFNDAIKEKLVNESPIARAAVVAATAKERDSAHLGDLSVAQLMQNPALYKIRGIDPDAYAAKASGDAEDLLGALK